MLDWSKIDTWQKFQRLCNALFELEMNSTDFFPSDPNVGADGGQDGKIRNNGNYLDKSGTFLIQAKHQKDGTDPKKAFDNIKKELIKKEFRNYNKHKADWLFLCINVPLNTKTDYRKELNELAQKNNVNLVVCDRTWLEGKIKNKHPYLEKVWFEGVQNLSIETPKVYFENYEKYLIQDNILCCEARYADLNIKFDQFITSNDKFMGIFAPGGEGKTHYLRNVLSNNLLSIDRKCYFVKDLEKNVPSIFEHELNREQQYLLVVDDLDKWIQSDLRSLLKHIHYSQTVKLLFTSRCVNKAIFEGVLGSIGINNLQLYSFSPWQESELLEILTKLVDIKKVADKKKILEVFNKPFYLKLIANAINQSEKVNSGNVISLITTREKNLFNNVAHHFVSKKLHFNLNVLLFELALILPSYQIERLSVIFQNYLGLNKDDSNKMITALINDGFLRHIGSSYRFSPDMKGDVFIANAFESLTESEIREIIKKWFEKEPDQVVKNLYYSIAFEDEPQKKITKFLKDLANKIISDFTLSNKDKLLDILNKIEYLALIAPDVGQTLIRDALLFLEKNALPKKTWNSDKFADLLKTLMLHKKCDQSILKFIFKMHDLQLDGYYDNQKITSLLRYFVSPAYFKIQVVLARLKSLLNASEAKNQNYVKLFKAAFQELLSGAYAHSKSLSHAMVLGAIPFNATEEGIGIRNDCINFIVTEWLCSHNYILVSAALDIIEYFGRVYLGGVTLDDNHSARLDSEQEIFFDALNSDKFVLDDFRIASRIEKMLLRWWSRGNDAFLSKIEKFLISKIPDTGEFYLYKYFERGFLCILKPFSAFYKDCPKDADKWHWLVDHVEANRYKWKEENYIEFASHLQKEYSTPDLKLSLFERLLKITELPTDKIWYVWVSQEINDFYCIFNDKTKWDRLPDSIQKIAFCRLSERYSEVKEEYKKYFYEKLPSPDLDELQLYLSFIKDDLAERTKLYNIFVKKSSHDIVSSLIFEIKNEADNAKFNFLRKYLVRIDNLDDSKIDHNIDFMLQIFTERNKKRLINDDLRHLLAQKLIKTRIWSDHVSDIIKIANFSKEQLWELLNSRKFDNYSSEERVPYLFVSSLNKVFNPENYKYIFYKLSKLKYDIRSNPFSELINLRSNEGDLYIEPLFDEISKNLESLRKLLEHLDFNNTSFFLWEKGIRILINEVKNGNLKNSEIEELLSYKTIPSGAYSSSPEQEPPALVQIRDLFIKLKKAINEPLLDAVVDKCVNYVKKHIKDSIDHDKLFTLGR